MTARIDPALRKRRPQDDLSVKPRIKSKQKTSPEGKARRLSTLLATTPHHSNSGNVALIAQHDPNRPLTEKQKVFVAEWAKGETILSASVRAGYADGGSMAYRLSKDPAILKIYHREKALYEEASQMTRKKVMDGFLEAADMARTLADPTALTGAWREVGKLCGYYEPVKRTIDINVSGNVTMKKLEALDDAALLQLIKGEVEEVEFKEIEEEDA